MKDYSGEAFLNKLYRDLHMSDVVMIQQILVINQEKKLVNIWKD